MVHCDVRVLHASRTVAGVLCRLNDAYEARSCNVSVPYLRDKTEDYQKYL